MKVALYHHLGPGGAARLVAETVRRSRHDITWFRIGDEGIDALAASAGRVEAYPATRGGRLEPVGLARTERRVAGDIDDGCFDVVLVHPCQVFQAPGVLRFVTTPSVYYVHEPRRRSFEAGYLEPSAPLRSVARRAYHGVLGRRDQAAVRAASSLVANSVFTAESVRAVYGVDARVCRPGVDPVAFPFSGAPRSRSVLSVGGLEHTKGHGRVIAALALLDRRERPELHLVHNRGSVPDERRLLDEAARHGVRLQLHRDVSHDDLVGLYQMAAVTVCAADLEPFGLTSLESIACGTPVVAVNRGGVREVVDNGVTGRLAEPRPDAVAAALAPMLAAPACLAEPVRDAAVGRWSWEVCAEGIDQACDEAAA